jgi:hypothetical protein
LTASGEAIWDEVNVFYARYNGTVFDGWVVVSLDPGLTHIISTELQVGNPSASDVKQQLWSGYGFGGNSGFTASVYESYGSWKIPALSQPYSGACPNASSACLLLIWSGLTSDPTNNLIQGGSISNLSLTGGNWVTVRDLWFESQPGQDSVQYCGNSSTVQNSDVITSDVESHALNGGNVDTFDIFETDITNYAACSSTNNYVSAVGTPTNALLIFEIGNTIGGRIYTLPSFGDAGGVNDRGYTYYGGSIHDIIDPYNAGYYNTYSMWNPDNNGYHNIGISTVFQNSSFNEYFNTASGT